MTYELIAKDSTSEIWETPDGSRAIGILKDNTPRKFYRVLKRDGSTCTTLAARCTYEVARAIVETEIK